MSPSARSAVAGPEPGIPSGFRYGILAAAGEQDALLNILGAARHTDLPHLALGSVSHRLLHLARRPVLIVPRVPAARDGRATATTGTTAGTAAS